jgi:glyoxylase-like metal-dependent hydrolase (beta-lactamase superfamily II)
MTTLVEHSGTEGVALAELPLPFPVGPVNCWILVDRPVTVVDPGMLYDDSTDRIEAALAEAGLPLTAVDQVVVTHAHPDHFGAAAWLSAIADAPIICGEPEAIRLTRFGPDHADERRSHYIELLRSVGVPTELEDTFSEMRSMVQDWLRPVAASMLVPLADGEELQAGGQRFTAHVTPGHSPGHLSLHHGETLVSGDHLLAHITPNPFIESDDTPLGRRRSLVEYLSSLERFERLDPGLVLPGHGPAFTDVPRLTASLRAHHQARADEILALIAEVPGSTIFELAERYFSELESFHIVLGVSEIAGHVDLLETRGQVVSHGAPHRYRPAS